MTHAGYLVAGYTVTAGVLAAYVAWVLARTRLLAPRSEVAIDGPIEAHSIDGSMTDDRAPDHRAVDHPPGPAPPDAGVGPLR